jgi:hypothetical protein
MERIPNLVSEVNRFLDGLASRRHPDIDLPLPCQPDTSYETSPYLPHMARVYFAAFFCAAQRAFTAVEGAIQGVLRAYKQQ